MSAVIFRSDYDRWRTNLKCYSARYIRTWVCQSLIPDQSRKEKRVNEDKLLKILAEDYWVNPGLYMSRADIQEWSDIENENLDSLLMSLEEKDLLICIGQERG